MKLDIKVHAGRETQSHRLELPASAELAKATQGRLPYVLDGQAREADWAKISDTVYSILIDGRSYQVTVRTRAAGDLASRSGAYRLTVGQRHYLVEVEDPRRPRSAAVTAGPAGPQEILAPMPGRIVKILVAENQQVSDGEGLLVIEAMKMQNELRAPRAGSVEKIYVREGSGVESGFKLLRLV
jgi:biotin carboxyl carrier protein